MAQWVPGRLGPRIILTFRHYKGDRSSAKFTGRHYPRRNPWYSFSEAESTSGHMVLSGVPRKKIPSDTTGNRSRDRPTSSSALTTMRKHRKFKIFAFFYSSAALVGLHLLVEVSRSHSESTLGRTALNE